MKKLGALPYIYNIYNEHIVNGICRMLRVKEGFPNSIKCRIINPASNNLGKVSKDTGQNKRQVQRSYWRKPMEKHKKRSGLVHKRACSQPHQDESKIPTVRHMRILSINNRRTTPQIPWFR